MTGVLVPYGSVVDTTGDPGWAPVRVTAVLAEPVVALASHPAHLDGPLSWAAYVAARRAGVRIPPIEPDWAPDFTLPLATWTAPAPAGCDPRLCAADPARVWGWACSRAHYNGAHTVVVTRRRPATDVMARYTTDRRHHLSAGPLKARSQPTEATLAREVTWWALADPEPLRAALVDVPVLGRKGRHGHGRILTWHVEADPDAAARWQDRDWPDPAGLPGSLRAPYWHASRRLPCSSTRPA